MTYQVISGLIKVAAIRGVAVIVAADLVLRSRSGAIRRSVIVHLLTSMLISRSPRPGFSFTMSH